MGSTIDEGLGWCIIMFGGECGEPGGGAYPPDGLRNLNERRGSFTVMVELGSRNLPKTVANEKWPRCQDAQG